MQTTMKDIRSSTTIQAPIERVWKAITTPSEMKQWFFGVDTEADWRPGGRLIHRGEYQGKALYRRTNESHDTSASRSNGTSRRST